MGRRRIRPRRRFEDDERAAQTPPDWPDYAIAGGLALVVFARPWRDGASFQGFNAYFVWLTMALAALWTARLLFQQTTFRFIRFTIPLVVFIAAALVSSFDSYMPDHTYRGLLYWTTYISLFALASNVLRTPATRGVFFAGLAATMACSAAWALVHLEYVLPTVREMMEQDPGARRYYFQTSDLSADLVHRLSINRAYGATLFPNALAAFMILALPFMVAEFIAAILEWRKLEETGEPVERPRWFFCAGIGAAVAAVLGVCARLLFPFLYFVVTKSPEWRSADALSATAIYAIPITSGISIAFLLSLVGTRRAWLYVQMVFLPIAVSVVAIALFKTYSRGGMLALAVASSAVTALVLYRFKFRGVLSKTIGVLLVLTIVLCAVGAQAQERALPREGVQADVLSPGSVLARLDYWHVGWEMIKDNPITGVGLGAFGAAYPNYMFPGAATSQMAHNHLIQVLAEVGPVGLASIAAFWLLFLLYGVRSILAAPDLMDALRIAGPFTGVVAFLMHSCVDFNFANPSLAMTAFVVAGASCARCAARAEPSGPPPKIASYTAVPILVVIVVVVGGMARIFAVDYALTGPIPVARKLMLAGNRLEIRDKLYSAKFYLEKLAAHAENPQRVLYSDYDALFRIVPDHHRILEFGFVARLETGVPNRFVGLPAEELLSPDAVVVITDVDRARAALIDSADALLEDLAVIDRPYPFILEVSMHAYQWCDLVFNYAPDLETKRRFAALGHAWAARSIERAPYQSAAWLSYGKALWQRASVASGTQAEDYYDKGLAAYRRAAETFPASPDAWENYATALEKLGEGILAGGREAEGRELLTQAEAVRQHVHELRQEWVRAQAPR